MQDNSQDFANKLAIKKNQVSADIKAEPEYYLTHNKECAAFRARVMSDTDDFNRGYLFGTACICHGAEDRILHNIKVSITRYYQSGDYSVVTQQNGSIQQPELMEELQKIISKGNKLDPKKHSAFSKEVAVELNFG